MHIMTDIETLGSQDGAQIIQLSAVAFELNGTVLEPHELLQYDDRWFDACILPYAGGSETSNMAFWAGAEARAAKARIEVQPQVEIADALRRFAAFVQRWLGKRGCMWAKPPQFDLRVLRGNYGWEGFTPTPWHFSQEKDLGSLVWAARKVPRVNFKVPDMGGAGLIKHYALHDAVEQAVVAQAAFRSLVYSAAQRSADRSAMLATQQQELEDAVEITESATGTAPGSSPA
jgi:hypothetical protein